MCITVVPIENFTLMRRGSQGSNRVSRGRIRQPPLVASVTFSNKEVQICDLIIHLHRGTFDFLSSRILTRLYRCNQSHYSGKPWNGPTKWFAEHLLSSKLSAHLKLLSIHPLGKLSKDLDGSIGCRFWCTWIAINISVGEPGTVITAHRSVFLAVTTCNHGDCSENLPSVH